MTKEEEIPDWVGAHEFYDKYDPKEVLGRYVHEVLQWPPAEVFLWASGHPKGGHKLELGSVTDKVNFFDITS